MCGFSPTNDPDNASDFRRGYTLACAVIAGILALEVIASMWLW